MKKQYEEEVMSIGYRLVDLLVATNIIEKKEEFVKLLQELNNIGEIIIKEDSEYKEELRKQPSKVYQEQFFIEINSYAYLWGRISILKSMINFVIKKLELSETKLSDEEQKEIIEKSKQDTDFNYAR